MNNILGAILTFLGGGAFTKLLDFLLNIRKEKKADSQSLLNDIYKEIGRLSQELKQVKEEKQQAEKENLELKERNMKLQIEFTELKKDYEELKAINQELRDRINILFTKQSSTEPS